MEAALEASRLEDWTEAIPEAIRFEAALGGDREAGGPRGDQDDGGPRRDQVGGGPEGDRNSGRPGGEQTGILADPEATRLATGFRLTMESMEFQSLLSAPKA